MKDIVAEELRTRLEAFEDHLSMYGEASVYLQIGSERGIWSPGRLAEEIASSAPGNERRTVNYDVYLHTQTGNELEGTLQATTGKGRVVLNFTPDRYPELHDVFRMSMVPTSQGYKGIAARYDYSWPNRKKDEGAFRIFSILAQSAKVNSE